MMSICKLCLCFCFRSKVSLKWMGPVHTMGMAWEALYTGISIVSVASGILWSSSHLPRCSLVWNIGPSSGSAAILLQCLLMAFVTHWYEGHTSPWTYVYFPVSFFGWVLNDHLLFFSPTLCFTASMRLSGYPCEWYLFNIFSSASPWHWMQSF